MSRQFTPARKAQGFKSQAHLDAFYAYFDHSHGNCADCGEGKAVFIDDSWQGTRYVCPAGQQLLDASGSEHF